MKLLVINLARAGDRRNFMRTQLDALKLDYEFITGSDYREMSDEDFRETCAPEVVAGDAYLKSVSAAALSHLKAYRHMIAEGLDYALICEDDVVFPPNATEILNQLEQKMRPDEIVMLAYSSHKHDALVLSNRDPQPITDKHVLLSPVEIEKAACAMAYIVPKSIAVRLVELLMPVNHLADQWGRFYQKGAFTHLRCLYPHIMAPTTFVSIIEYRAKATWAFKLKSRLRAIPGMDWCIGKLMHKKMMERYQYRLVDAPPFSAAAP